MTRNGRLLSFTLPLARALAHTCTHQQPSSHLGVGGRVEVQGEGAVLGIVLAPVKRLWAQKGDRVGTQGPATTHSEGGFRLWWLVLRLLDVALKHLAAPQDQLLVVLCAA